MNNSFKKKWPDILVIILAIFYFLTFSYFTILRHDNYYSYRFDLGNMEQTIYNTTKGRIFEMTDPEGFGNISRFKYHADFFLILISPIYALFPKTETLLILQAFILAIGAIPLYLLAKEVLKEKKLALIPAFLYLLYPALERSNYFDFHAVKFATTFLLFAFWFLYKKKYFWFIIFSILAISCKEQIPLIIALMSFYGAFKDKKYRAAGVIFGLMCFLYFYYAFFILIPKFQESGQHFIFKHFTNSDNGEGLTNISLNVRFLTDKSVWLLFFQTFLPLSFIPLLNPWPLIFTSPDIIPKILSNNPYYKSIDFQYTNPMIPFVFIAFIFGFNNCLKIITKLKIPFIIATIVLLMTALISLYFWSPFSGSFSGVPARKILQARPEKKFIDNFKKQVPDDKSVCTTNNLGSHFARRLLLYSFSNNAQEADYTLILKGDGNMIDQKTTEDVIKKLKSNPKYQKIAEYKDFIAFQKVKK